MDLLQKIFHKVRATLLLLQISKLCLFLVLGHFCPKSVQKQTQRHTHTVPQSFSDHRTVVTQQLLCTKPLFLSLVPCVSSEIAEVRKKESSPQRLQSMFRRFDEAETDSGRQLYYNKALAKTMKPEGSRTFSCLEFFLRVSVGTLRFNEKWSVFILLLLFQT